VYQDHFDGQYVSSARACGEIHPVRQVSGVTYQDLYIARGKVFKMEEGGFLKWSAQEDLEGCLLDDVYMYPDQRIANL